MHTTASSDASAVVNSVFRGRGRCARFRAVRILFLLAATWAAVVAAPSGPGDAALAYLEKIRGRKVDLEPGADTAIGPETSGAKRRQIARRLERMASDLGGEELELGQVKRDGELAAVLVRRSPGFDPTSLHVFPVALVLRDDRWQPAPLPASFENAGLPRKPALRERLDAMEGWMLRARALDLLALRDEASARIRGRIEKGLPLAKLRSMDSRQVADCFLDACQRRDVAVVVGLLGGLAEPQPTDLRSRIRVCEEMLADPSPPLGPWHLLTSGEVLRAVVHYEEDRRDALVSVGCLDPLAKPGRGFRPRVEFVHIELSRGRDQLWRVDPGEAFWSPEPADDSEDDDEIPVLDGDLLDAFPGALVALHPPVARDRAEAAEEATLSAVRTAGLAGLLETARISNNPGIARLGFGRLVRLWQRVNGAKSTCHLVPLARQERDGKSVLFLQCMTPRDPEAFDPVTLFFQRGDDGWLWLPDFADTDDLFAEWLEDQQQRWPGSWQDQLLSGCVELDEIPELEPPTEEEARNVVETWFRHLRDGSLEKALESCARVLGRGGRDELLRRAAMEIHDVAGAAEEPRCTASRRGKRVTVVDALVPLAAEPSHPVYPVVATSSGPRILLELDLFAGDSRTRQFLNRASIDRLRETAPELASELQDLMPKP